MSIVFSSKSAKKCPFGGYFEPIRAKFLISNASAQTIRKAQAAFSGVAEEMGVYNEEDVQALVDEVRYEKALI